MEKWIVIIFLCITRAGYAQLLSAKDIVAVCKMAKTRGYFAGDFDKSSKLHKLLLGKGFVHVQWKDTDPDFADDAAPAYAFKYYSKSVNAYLVFHPDGHGDYIDYVSYRFSSYYYFNLLRKQFKMLAGKESIAEKSAYEFHPSSDNTNFGYIIDDFGIDLSDNVKNSDDNKKIHSFSFKIYRIN